MQEDKQECNEVDSLVKMGENPLSMSNLLNLYYLGIVSR